MLLVLRSDTFGAHLRTPQNGARVVGTIRSNSERLLSPIAAAQLRPGQPAAFGQKQTLQSERNHPLIPDKTSKLKFSVCIQIVPRANGQ